MSARFITLTWTAAIAAGAWLGTRLEHRRPR